MPKNFSFRENSEPGEIIINNAGIYRYTDGDTVNVVGEEKVFFAILLCAMYDGSSAVIFNKEIILDTPDMKYSQQIFPARTKLSGLCNMKIYYNGTSFEVCCEGTVIPR